MSETKKTSLEQVADFMLTAKQPVVENKGILEERISPDRLMLRLSLCLEELCEIATNGFGSHGADVMRRLFSKKLREINQNLREGKYSENLNIKEVLDGLVDLRVVSDGFVHETGFGSVFDEAVEEVMDSNMSKFCKTEEVAQASVAKYKAEGVETYYEKHNDKFIIYRKEDDKVLKAINFRRPDLNRFIKE